MAALTAVRQLLLVPEHLFDPVRLALVIHCHVHNRAGDVDTADCVEDVDGDYVHAGTVSSLTRFCVFMDNWYCFFSSGVHMLFIFFSRFLPIFYRLVTPLRILSTRSSQELLLGARVIALTAKKRGPSIRKRL